MSDTQKYKAKAFIDMVVDRGGKALSSIALMVVIARSGVSITISLAVAFVAVLLWSVCAHFMGRAYAAKTAEAEDAAKREARAPKA